MEQVVYSTNNLFSAVKLAEVLEEADAFKLYTKYADHLLMLHQKSGGHLKNNFFSLL
jgi:hypothetical protein